jgi:EPS-associated MarR family transcriptional regulator
MVANLPGKDRNSLSSKEEASFRLMRLIEHNPKISQRELAKATGVSLGKAHYIISALIEQGYVRLERFGASSNRRAYLYVLTPHGMARKAAIAGRFLSRKMEEYDALSREIEELACEIGAEKGCLD